MFQLMLEDGQQQDVCEKKFHVKFQEEIAGLLAEGVFKPGVASLQDYIKNGRGDLAEGIRTTMKIGDLELFGEDTPDEASVDVDYAHFYEGNPMAPLASLLPTLTVSGTEETQAGYWKMLYEPERSRLWAFLRMLAKMKHAAMVGCDNQGIRCEKIMKDLLEALPVVIVKMQGEDELWAEWSRSQDTGHTDLQHSTERISVRFTFFSKLKQTLKKKLKDDGVQADVTAKRLFAAYLDAEKKQKFRIAKGMTGVKRDNELSQLLKWGDFITKIGEMDNWKALEVHAEGKTPFFTLQFGISFCPLIENVEAIAKFVLNTLTACMLDDKWRKRVLEANPARMKSIVKTFVLEWKWVKFLLESCKSKPIMPAEKMESDFVVIESVFNKTDALDLVEDSTGKKANLHPLSLELWDTCRKVLWEQTHFNTFQISEAMNKNFQNTVQLEALQKLCVSNILHPWTDAHAQFAGQVTIVEVDNDEDEEEEAGGESLQMRVPTRQEAIRIAAQNELDLFHGTSFVTTGDVTMDRDRLFRTEHGKSRTAQTAPWNPSTQGNRRGTIYDEKGRRNPKWTYVKGRNQYRSKVSFQKDDFEDFVDTWGMMAKPGEGPAADKIDVFMVWNAEQEKASAVISKKLKAMPGMERQVKKTLLKGLQAHVERRLWDGEPDGEVGELAGLPGMQEELFEAFAGPLPSRRKHKLKMGGIMDNMYPEELVPLRDPKKAQPVVLVEVQKMIFPPDEDRPHDGEKVVRSDEVWASCHSVHV